MQPHIHFLLVKNVEQKFSNIKKTLDEIKTEYIKQVKSDSFIVRRILPVDLYRAYKIVKNFVFN